jgi:hypothetical protein
MVGEALEMGVHSDEDHRRYLLLGKRLSKSSFLSKSG